MDRRFEKRVVFLALYLVKFTVQIHPFGNA